MDKKVNRKKISIFVPILWVFTTAIWAVTVYINIRDGFAPTCLIALQFAACIASFIAAIANFIRYKRDKNDTSD